MKNALNGWRIIGRGVLVRPFGIGKTSAFLSRFNSLKHGSFISYIFLLALPTLPIELFIRFDFIVRQFGLFIHASIERLRESSAADKNSSCKGRMAVLMLLSTAMQADCCINRLRNALYNASIIGCIHSVLWGSMSSFACYILRI